MPRQKIIQFLKIALLTALVCFSIIFFSYHLAYAEKIVPKVVVGSVSLGNRNEEEARRLLGEKFDNHTSQSIKFASAEKSFEFSFEDLGLGYDLERTIVAAFGVGRSGNLFDDLQAEFRAWFEGVEIEPILKVEEKKLDNALLKIAEELDDPPVEAELKIENGELRITEAEGGRVVNQEKLEGEILAALKNFSGRTIAVPIEEINPEITGADLEAVRPQVEILLASPVKLVYGSLSWTLTEEEVLSFLKFQKEDSGVKMGIEESNLAGYAKTIAGQVNREPRGDIFRADGERVVEFRMASEGLELDEEKTLQLLSDAILANGEEVALPVKVSQPLRSANEYGIRELLGRGVSNFAGSSQGRINNIKTASAKLRGILVAPGEAFSFNKSLGEVTADTGYSTAWVIKKGRTVLGVGGGVCQVSTTVFRAAFNSGLEISERTAHAYRVHYYEPPVGFDATVYEPSPDLVFKNDTANYVLIWSSVDVPSTTLTFSFYGTSDGRSTKMIGPFVSNESPPPPPLYQEDPSLPKGTTQQVDFAAWGADAVLKREVYRDGKILHNDTFTSHFKPWQAVYLVGTGQLSSE